MIDTGTAIRRAFRESEEAARQKEEQTRRSPDRRAAGRYTIDEAVQQIRAGAGAAALGIGAALARAVENGDITAYGPGSDIPYQHCAMVAWKECYGDDLNSWLNKMAPRLPFRFSACEVLSGKNAAETKEQRQARRYRMCIDAGLDVKVDTYARLPNGVGVLAKKENITQQAFSKDVKAHIERLVNEKKRV